MTRKTWIMPTLDVPVVTLARICRMKKNPNGVFVREEIDALVWDPTAVRALLDERIYRNPIVALIAPESPRTEHPCS